MQLCKNDRNKYCGSEECQHFYNTIYSSKKYCTECTKINTCNGVECYCTECWKSLFENFEKISEKVYIFTNGEYKLVENEVHEKIKMEPNCPGCEKFYDIDDYEEY